VQNFERVTKQKVRVKMEPRRMGDIVSMYADSQLAKDELGWEAKYDLEKMCEDFWRWQRMNPNGYKDHDLALL